MKKDKMEWSPTASVTEVLDEVIKRYDHYIALEDVAFIRKVTENQLILSLYDANEITVSSGEERANIDAITKAWVNTKLGRENVILFYKAEKFALFGLRI